MTVTDRVAEGDPRYEGWRVAVASAVGVFVSFASLLVYTFGIFLKPLADEFGWSREAISAAFGIAAMTVAVCSPPLGYLLDRVSPRRIIVPCMAVFGCAFASLSLLTPHLWHLYAMFFVWASSATARRRWRTPGRVELVRGAAGHGAGGRHVRRRDWRDGAAAGRRGADRARRLARGVRGRWAAWSW